jgi:hypothetical protein
LWWNWWSAWNRISAAGCWFFSWRRCFPPCSLSLLVLVQLVRVHTTITEKILKIE